MTAKHFSLRIFNNILSIVIICLALYVLITPFVPQIVFAVRKNSAEPAPYGALGNISTEVSNPSKPLPADNRIVIPSALIDQPIVSSPTIDSIAHGGAWNKPLWTESPLDEGNTLILGHRFTYTQPEGAFYHLDKVQVGDALAVYWQGKELLYTITERKIVPPEAIEVENNTPDRTLTMYTCTPLFTATQRLVLIAKPRSDSL